MKRKFESHNFTNKSLALIAKVEQIFTSYVAQGYDLSLRQTYYQLVSQNIIPNNERSYDNLGALINNARLAGLLDWDVLVDRGRIVERNNHFADPADFLERTHHWFDLDLWQGQKNYVEVMVEKQALEGVIQPVCEKYDVPFSANKGYTSASSLYRTAQRYRAALAARKKLFVVYLGDHDPSGLDMTRDVGDRLGLFTGLRINVDRIALNMDQIEELQPPENPAKMTDSRAAAYVEQFGDSSWELDAVEPAALATMVRKAIEKRLNMDAFNARKKDRRRGRKAIENFADEYRMRAESGDLPEVEDEEIEDADDE